MIRTRQMIGRNALDTAVELVKQGIAITSIVKLLELEQMHYRTAFDIIKADSKGYKNVSRPEWLKETPDVQESPDGWYLVNGFTKEGHWAESFE